MRDTAAPDKINSVDSGRFFMITTTCDKSRNQRRNACDRLTRCICSINSLFRYIRDLMIIFEKIIRVLMYQKGRNLKKH